MALLFLLMVGAVGLPSINSKLNPNMDSWACQIGYRAEVSVNSPDFEKLTDIQWLRNDEVIKPNNQHYVINTGATNSSLTIMRVVSTDFDVKQWVFSAVSPAGETLTHDFGPITQLPSVEGFIPDDSDKVTRTSISKTDGSPLKLQCKISVDVLDPDNMSVSWTFQKEGSKTQVPITENLSAVLYNFDAINIESLKNADRGFYQCIMHYRMANQVFNSTMETRIRVKSKFGALWPFIAIIVEVALLIALILIFERRQKNKIEESSPDEERLSTSRTHEELNSDVGPFARRRQMRRNAAGSSAAGSSKNATSPSTELHTITTTSATSQSTNNC